MQAWQDFMNRKYTQNEINNIVYVCLKYTFGRRISGLDNPPNSDIYSILLEIGDNTETDNIAKVITGYVVSKFIDYIDNTDASKYEQFMHFIIDEFNQLPDEIRNDLGEDTNAEEFITKH